MCMSAVILFNKILAEAVGGENIGQGAGGDVGSDNHDAGRPGRVLGKICGLDLQNADANILHE